MPSQLFEPGNKAAPGGKREGAGRPRKGQVAASQLVKMVIEANATKLANQYIKRALDKYGDRVLCHAIDKLLPDDRNVTIQPTAIIHQFIQFGANPDNSNTIQLSAEGLSNPVLGGDDTGTQEKGSDDMASQVRQGQDSIKFRSFANVPRKRR